MFVRTFEYLQRWLIIVPAVVAFLCLSCQDVLETRWLSHQRTPIPKVGQTVPMLLENTTVYVEPWERDLSRRMHWCLYICVAVAIASEIGRRRWRLT
jgi:hypothetical protein